MAEGKEMQPLQSVSKADLHKKYAGILLPTYSNHQSQQNFFFCRIFFPPRICPQSSTSLDRSMPIPLVPSPVSHSLVWERVWARRAGVICPRGARWDSQRAALCPASRSQRAGESIERKDRMMDFFSCRILKLLKSKGYSRDRIESINSLCSHE